MISGIFESVEDEILFLCIEPKKISLSIPVYMLT